MAAAHDAYFEFRDCESRPDPVRSCAACDGPGSPRASRGPMIRSTVQRGTRIPAAADAPTSEPRTRNLARSHPRRQRTSSSRQRFQRRHRGQPRPRWSEDLGCRRQRCHAVHIDVNARWAIEADRDAGRATDSGCDGRCARRGDARSARRAVYGPGPAGEPDRPGGCAVGAAIAFRSVSAAHGFRRFQLRSGRDPGR